MRSGYGSPVCVIWGQSCQSRQCRILEDSLNAGEQLVTDSDRDGIITISWLEMVMSVASDVKALRLSIVMI